MADIYRRIFRRLLWSLCLLYGQPQLKYPTADQQNLIHSLRNTYPDEVSMYDLIMDRFRTGYVLHIMVSMTLVLHHTIMPTAVFSSLDFKDPEKNIKFINSTIPGQQAQIEFLCMTTNCTKLSDNPSGIATDLLELNYFPVCYPRLVKSPFFHSFDNLPLGKFNHIIIAILLFISNVVFIVLQNVSHCWCPSLMLMAAPSVTAKLVLVNMKIIHDDYLRSLANYKSMSLEIREKLEKKEFRLAGYMRYRARKTESKSNLKSLETKLTSFREIRGDNLDDCISITHTKWWSDMQVRNTVIISTALTSLMIMFVLLGLIGPFIYLRYVHNKRLDTFETFMQTSGCAFWLTDAPQATFMDPLRDQIPFNLFNILVAFFYVLVYLTMSISGIVAVYEFISVLNMRLMELEFMILVAGEMIRVLDRDGIHDIPNPALSLKQEGQQSSLMVRLRQQMMDTMKINIISHANTSVSNILSARTEAETRIALERFATTLLSEEGPNSAAELVEKIYLNFREFLWSLEIHNSIIGPVVTILQLLVYSYAGFSIFLRKTMKNFLLTSFLTVGVVITVVVLVVSVGANFYSNEPSMKHLRLLWLKVINVLAREDGIYFKAFGVRIVHGFILRITVVTSTIVILALK